MVLFVLDRSPKSVFWSATEPQLFTCEAFYTGGARTVQPKNKTKDAKSSTGNVVSTNSCLSDYNETVMG